MAEGRATRLAEWALRGPLAVVVGAWCGFQLVAWAPQYLTWPWFADHDVFATMAQGWDAGLRPYRDLRSNNFPGTIYLFWVVGKLFGWGRTWGFYALDVMLLVLFGGVLLGWNRRRHGRVLPGLVGFAALLTYDLGLDFTQAAQRDWQAPLLAATGLLVVQGWPVSAGRLTSAPALAAALTIRPQALAFLPALLIAVAAEAPPGRRRGAATAWSVALAAGLVLGFAPLVWSGVFGDFLRSLGLLAYGGDYNEVTVRSFMANLIGQLASVPAHSWLVPVGIALAAGQVGPAGWRQAMPWLAAWGGVLLYQPLSPQPLLYLAHPLHITGALHLAVLAGLVLDLHARDPLLKLLLILTLLGTSATVVPPYCGPIRSLEAFGTWAQDGRTERPPLGYATSYPDVVLYRWSHYQGVLDYLRTRLGPRTRVANLVNSLAVTGPSGRLPALPAESIDWLSQVRPVDEALFARTLERSADSVVVVDVSRAGFLARISYPSLPRLKAVVLRVYEPEARFGTLEVWRRKSRDTGSPPR
jgi:hypothetical protein